MHHHSDRSVDEILKAIQKVIESDNRDSAQAERRRRENHGVMLNGANQRESAAKPQADAFLVTSELAAEDADADADADEGILDLGTGATALPDEDVSGNNTADEEAEQPAPKSSIAPERIIAQIEETLTSERAAESMRRSLSNLSRISEAPGNKAAPAGETTIEQLVREMLRPMLAQWLDANLPPLVEQMVKAEIARISARRD